MMICLFYTQYSSPFSTISISGSSVPFSLEVVLLFYPPVHQRTCLLAVSVVCGVAFIFICFYLKSNKTINPMLYPTTTADRREWRRRIEKSANVCVSTPSNSSFVGWVLCSVPLCVWRKNEEVSCFLCCEHWFLALLRHYDGRINRPWEGNFFSLSRVSFFSACRTFWSESFPPTDGGDGRFCTSRQIARIAWLLLPCCGFLWSVVSNGTTNQKNSSPKQKQSQEHDHNNMLPKKRETQKNIHICTAQPSGRGRKDVLFHTFA